MMSPQVQYKIRQNDSSPSISRTRFDYPKELTNVTILYTVKYIKYEVCASSPYFTIRYVIKSCLPIFLITRIMSPLS